jgi:hypothetical protein
MHGVVGDHARLTDGHAGSVQVDVGPAQPEQLAATHAGGRGQQPRRVLAVAFDVGEEGAELPRRPDLELSRLRLRRVSGVGHVAHDVAPAHRVPERPVDQDMDIPDRLGGQAARPVPAAGGQQLSI